MTAGSAGLHGSSFALPDAVGPAEDGGADRSDERGEEGGGDWDGWDDDGADDGAVGNEDLVDSPTCGGVGSTGCAAGGVSDGWTPKVVGCAEKSAQAPSIIISVAPSAPAPQSRERTRRCADGHIWPPAGRGTEASDIDVHGTGRRSMRCRVLETS